MNADEFVEIALLRAKFDAQAEPLCDFSSVRRQNVKSNHTQLQINK